MQPSQRRISRGFCIAHIITVMVGVGFVLCGLFTYLAEQGHLANFNLKTNNSSLTKICYATGIILIFSAGLGFTAQLKANKPCFWILYCILMGVMTLVEFVVGGSAISKSTKNHDLVKDELLFTKMNEYTGIGNMSVWDSLQRDKECCGVDDYKDWQSVQFGRTSLKVPISCCLLHLRQDQYCGQNLLPDHVNASQLIFIEGCLSLLNDPVDLNLLVMGVYGVVVSVLQAALVGVSSYLLIIKKL